MSAAKIARVETIGRDTWGAHSHAPAGLRGPE